MDLNSIYFVLDVNKFQEKLKKEEDAEDGDPKEEEEIDENLEEVEPMEV